MRCTRLCGSAGRAKAHAQNFRQRLLIELISGRDLAIDSKLRGCDVVAIRVEDVAAGGYTADRATVRQKNWATRQTDMTALMQRCSALHARLNLGMISRKAVKARSADHAKPAFCFLIAVTLGTAKLTDRPAPSQRRVIDVVLKIAPA
jgi:hypothetical protein